MSIKISKYNGNCIKAVVTLYEKDAMIVSSILTIPEFNLLVDAIRASLGYMKTMKLSKEHVVKKIEEAMGGIKKDKKVEDPDIFLYVYAMEYLFKDAAYCFHWAFADVIINMNEKNNK